MFNEAEAIIAELVAHPERLPGYVWAVESLMKDREQLLAIIPPCSTHGALCSAHAKQWLCEQRARALGLWDEA